MFWACCFRDTAERYSSPLHKACAEGKIKKVRDEIILQGRHMRPNERGETVLMWAAEHGQTTLIDEILAIRRDAKTPGPDPIKQIIPSDVPIHDDRIGWDINSCDSDGHTVLGRVIRSTELTPKQRLEMVETLLKLRDSWQQRLLVLELLDLNRGSTSPYMLALRQKDEAVANLLLTFEVDVTRKERGTNRTALVEAVDNMLLNQVSILLGRREVMADLEMIRGAYDLAVQHANDSKNYNAAQRRIFNNIITLFQTKATEKVPARAVVTSVFSSKPGDKPLNPSGVRSSVTIGSSGTLEAVNPLTLAGVAGQRPSLGSVPSWRGGGGAFAAPR